MASTPASKRMCLLLLQNWLPVVKNWASGPCSCTLHREKGSICVDHLYLQSDLQGPLQANTSQRKTVEFFFYAGELGLEPATAAYYYRWLGGWRDIHSDKSPWNGKYWEGKNLLLLSRDSMRSPYSILLPSYLYKGGLETPKTWCLRAHLYKTDLLLITTNSFSEDLKTPELRGRVWGCRDV